MPLLGQLGSGVRVGYSTASPHSWSEVNQIRDVTPPGKSRPDVDSTVHGTTGIAKNIPGLATVEDMTITLMADLEAASSPTHTALRTFEASQATLWWRVEVPIDEDLATTDYLPMEFQGRVAAWRIVAPVDGLKEIEVVVKFNGDDLYYLAAGASAF